ncbi:MAG: sugar ABC transporter permease [Actinobacteria bacterium]|nr:sugar ABC transporter permease [Actinomycetota bacterium]MBW3650290.1 sugar ABC transporter permease [Actinomycetota bacterium]
MDTLVSTVVGVVAALAVVAGLFTALNLVLDRSGQRWDSLLRPWVFVGPAMVFLAAALIIPAVRTIGLSFRAGRRGEDGFSLAQWRGALTDRNVISFDGFTQVLTSRLFLAALALVVVGVVVARVSATRGTGSAQALDLSHPLASTALAVAVIAVLLAVFSTLRGIIWNNLWWVAAVAGLATLFGLALAVLADRSRNETAAKTLIFMPMAISLVGAAIIWKYVYDTPGAGQAEGLLNVLWPGDPIDFLRGTSSTGTIAPWNNFFIMIIMIWIQSGFAMVVLSAAIKGVPTELLEAARVDGANEVQVFWRVTLPQITSTIAVVVTTLTITVLKIFDLVKATTGGAAGTDVLANRMYEGLRNGNFTSSATFAVMILVLVLPVMWINIRRTRDVVAR